MSWLSDLKAIIRNLHGAGQLVEAVREELGSFGINTFALPKRFQHLIIERANHAYYNRANPTAKDIAREIHLSLCAEGWSADSAVATVSPSERMSTAQATEVRALRLLTEADEQHFGGDLIDLVRRVARATVSLGSITRMSGLPPEDSEMFGNDLLDLVRRATGEAFVDENPSWRGAAYVTDVDRERFGEDLIDCLWRAASDEFRRLRDAVALAQSLMEGERPPR